MNARGFIQLMALGLVASLHCIRGLGADSARAPVVFDFTPRSAEVGSSVEIRGTNLASATAVQFNTQNAMFTAIGDAISATVPTNATTGPITVVTPDGTNTTSELFTVTAPAPPIITGFLPVSGKIGSSIEIQGTNLTKATSVKFNGVEADFEAFGGTLRTTVPPGATTGPITVKTPGGTSISMSAFTVEQLTAPLITGFSPTTGARGSQVEIHGSNLVAVTAVQFNGLNAAFLSFGESLRATVPLNASSGPITVITPGGTNISKNVFMVTAGPTPTITSVTPSGGEPGITVEIRGTFLRDVSAVRFNGADAVFTNSLFRPLSAVVPVTATTGPITVVTPGGTAISPDIFSVTNLLAPVIESFSPTSGATGTLVDVRGTNLAGLVSVQFNGAEATFAEFSSGRFFTFVPTNAVTGPITIITKKGIGKSQNEFTVLKSTVLTEVTISVSVAATGDIELSWPAEAQGFVLQSADSLDAGVTWSAVSEVPTIVSGKSVVKLNPTTKQKFFRLVRP